MKTCMKTCMKTWSLVCLKLLSVALFQTCTLSPARVQSLQLFWRTQRKQKIAKMNFCDALTCFWNNFGDDWAGPTHVALWMPSPRLLPRDAFPELVLRHRGCCRDAEQGSWTRFLGGLFCNSYSWKVLSMGKCSGGNFSSIAEKVGKTYQQRNQCCQEGCPFFLPLQTVHKARPDLLLPQFPQSQGNYPYWHLVSWVLSEGRAALTLRSDSSHSLLHWLLSNLKHWKTIFSWDSWPS